MKPKKIKFVPLKYEEIKVSPCYVCKKKNKHCKCIECIFCGTINKNKECKYCKKKHTVDKITVSNAELNAMEDLSFVDLKIMFDEKRDKEIEMWQDRCKSVWHRLVRKIDE